MAAETCKHILKGGERIPLCNCMTVPVQSSLSHIHQPKTAKLLSSHTIQALTLIHHLQTVTSHITLNAFSGGSANSWPSLLHDSGFFSMPAWRHFSPASYLQPLCSLPCLLWFRRPAVLWAPAAPPSLALPVKTDRQRSYCILLLETQVIIYENNDNKGAQKDNASAWKCFSDSGKSYFHSGRIIWYLHESWV